MLYQCREQKCWCLGLIITCLECLLVQACSSTAAESDTRSSISLSLSSAASAVMPEATQKDDNPFNNNVEKALAALARIKPGTPLRQTELWGFDLGKFSRGREVDELAAREDLLGPHLLMTPDDLPDGPRSCFDKRKIVCRERIFSLSALYTTVEGNPITYALSVNVHHHTTGVAMTVKLFYVPDQLQNGGAVKYVTVSEFTPWISYRDQRTDPMKLLPIPNPKDILPAMPLAFPVGILHP